MTTDHGRRPGDGRHHGGQTDRERSTWIVTNTSNTNTYFKEYTPGIVDVFPTIADFMNIGIPIEVKRELDGISFLKPTDILDLKSKKEKRKLTLNWKPLSKGEAKVYLCGSNGFGSGSKDVYTLLRTVPIEKGRTSIPLKKLPKGFNKLVLETPNTVLNTWINSRTAMVKSFGGFPKPN